MEPISIATALGVGGVLTALVQRLLNRKAVEVESDTKLITSATQVVAMVEAQMKVCQAEQQKLRAEVEHLVASVELLTEEVHRLGGDASSLRPRYFR